MSGSKTGQLVLQGLIFIAVLGVLGVSVAVLITLLNQNSSSDSTTVAVTPAPTPAPHYTKNVLRLPSPISPDNPKYTSYKSYSQLLQSWLNKSVDPCDDFYAFTCSQGQAKNLQMSFDISDDTNRAAMLKQIQKDDYVQKASKPVQQLSAYFQACKQGKFRDNDHAKAILDSVFTNTNAYFPMLYQDHAHAINNSDPNTLALLLGYQTGAYDLASLISVSIDTNWKDPHGVQSYSLQIDQPATLYGASVYKKIWNTRREEAIAKVINVMTAVSGLYNLKLDADLLKADATAVVDFDYELATNFSTDSVLRRQYDRSYQPRTISDLQKELPYLNWTSFLQLVTTASPAASARLSDSSFFVLLMEPLQLARLAEIFHGDAARQAVVNNYVFYRAAALAAKFIKPAVPGKTRTGKNEEVSQTSFLDDLAWEPRSRRRHIRRQPRRPVDAALDENGDLSGDCMDLALDDLQWATARIFTDNVYPTKADKDAVRKNVGSIVQSILVAFRSQLDQLSWMTASTKRGAYSKIDNLVMNIAFPDWVTDDNKLSDYYKDLDISSADEFLTMKTKLDLFNRKKSYDLLAINGGADRTDFNGPPGITNAWYQPEVNSITFPGGILHAPFYDVNYPAAVNYGSMGVIAGHELTHGFDDEGVQWDGTGVLKSWMDANSSSAFSEMAACVVDEYSGFCPLGPGRPCIDGAQTQGENIADNGGMQAAFRAFRAALALNGPDPLLPDDSSIFSAEQIFFLSFANIWCQVPPKDDALERQLLTDVHSPSLQRVLGTIQNFPEFRNAFNCPVNTPYAPEKHCKVWTSDIAPASTDDKGIPVVSGNDINVKAPEEIGTKNLVKYNAYKSAFQLFNDSIDFTTDPCDDFYQYACGHYPGRQNTFYDLNDKNRQRIARKLNDPAYAATVQSGEALKKLKAFFGRCMDEQANPTKKNNHLVATFVSKLKEILGVLPTFLSDNPIPDKIDAKKLANALAYLSFEHGIDTLITPLVDTNWKAAGYEFYVDQSSLYFQNVYYQEKPWGTIETSYRLAAKALVKNYCLLENITSIDIADAEIDDAIGFEKDLGYYYTSRDDSRRDYSRQYNPASIQKPPPFLPVLDIEGYIHSEYAPDELKTFPADKQFIVNELKMSRRLFEDLSNPKKYFRKTIVNYLYMRLLLNYDTLVVPSEMETASHLLIIEELRTTQGRPTRRRAPLFLDADAAADASLSCASSAMNLLADASGRVYMDDAFPTDDDRKNLRVSAGGVIKNVLDSFSGMITQLDWMDDQSKKGAQDKITNVVKNVAFPDKLYNFTQLDAEYEKLDIDMKTTYYELLVRINKFNIAKQFTQLTMKVADRHDFLGQTSIVNAWYQPELNSITFPAGILQAPYFDARNPAALNYGAMGIVAGHELTHGFDDEGVQWNSVGFLDSWMTPESAANFSTVAQCVIDQYSNFCPLPESEPVRCINGVQTQGENIADNGGIHAAWRAFLAHRELNGPDPLFADHVFSQFSEEQLFFLNFAQLWCMAPVTKDYIITRILTDPHVFGFYRVLGSLQNFPAFRAAFNCPIGSKYAPADHCKVWVPFVMAK